MNDAPVDVGVAEQSRAIRVQPVTGKALPIFGMVAYYDFNWSDKFSTAIGYSRLDIDNSNGQVPDGLQERASTRSTNLLWYPVKNVMTGLEFQWGRRQNFTDGFAVERLPHPVLGAVQVFVRSGRKAVSRRPRSKRRATGNEEATMPNVEGPHRARPARRPAGPRRRLLRRPDRAGAGELPHLGRRAAALSQPDQGVRHGQARGGAGQLRLRAVLARRS